MAKTTYFELTLHDLRVIDGDTIEAWIDFAGIVRVKKVIRLPGIEGGEMDEVQGRAAAQILTQLVADRLQKTPRLRGPVTHTDQHGRVVADIVFDTGESLVALCLLSGLYCLRSRDGRQQRPTPPSGTTKTAAD